MKRLKQRQILTRILAIAFPALALLAYLAAFLFGWSMRYAGLWSSLSVAAVFTLASPFARHLATVVRARATLAQCLPEQGSIDLCALAEASGFAERDVCLLLADTVRRGEADGISLFNEGVTVSFLQ